MVGLLLFIVAVALIIVGIISIIVLKDIRDHHAFPIFLLIVGAVLMVLTTVNIVPTGYTGIVTTFGKVEDVTLDAGINMLAPWKSVVKMDNRIQKESTELQCFSSDIQEVHMSYTINYQIEHGTAMKIYSSIGQNYYNTVIVPCITESVKTVTAKYTAESLISNRTELAAKIEEDLAAKLTLYNIALVSTSIEDMDFTDEFTNAVENKQVAQQNELKAEIEAKQLTIEAQAEADASVISAQAKADALRIQADAEAEANKKISNSLTEEILKKMYYDTWNGVLPTVVGNESTVLLPN